MDPIDPDAAKPKPPLEPTVERGQVRARDFVRFDPRVFVGGIPVGVFFVVNHFGPAQWAIAASFAASVVVFVRNRSSGIIRVLSVLSFAIIAVSAVIGLILNSDRAFVAQNIAGDFIFAVVSVVSVAIRRPLIGAIAREVTPGIKPVMAIEHPVFVMLTLANAGLNVATGVARWVMLDALSANAYSILSRVVFLPLNVAFVAVCYWAVARAAIRIWPADAEFEHLRR